MNLVVKYMSIENFHQNKLGKQLFNKVSESMRLGRMKNLSISHKSTFTDQTALAKYVFLSNLSSISNKTIIVLPRYH